MRLRDAAGRRVVARDTSADVLREPLDPREDAFLDGAFDLAGKRVLTAEGDEVGTVDEVDFDDRSGRLERILLAGGGALTIAAVVAVGPYAVILPA